MQQAKFSLTEGQMKFLERHHELGFKDRSGMVRAALQKFQAEVERERMEESADLYASVYAEDEDLRTLTEDAVKGWPE